ncbi:MAG: prepilin-type N-terminal cleavage/methylation domain-containing protein [Fibromonadales bacterium]|nr:prepilin-type N-terminal cleavage/methylation domain-containing protein [Fibromonadales bacterium]
MEIVRKIQCGAAKNGSPTAGQTAAPAVVPKKAFTLIELLVYMAIMGFIIVVAGRAFSDSTKMRIRSQNMLASTEEAGQVASLLKEDLSQMGTKTWAKPGSGTNLEHEIGLETLNQANAIYENYNQNENTVGADFSSYSLLRSGDNDKLNDITFRKVKYNSDGIYQAVQQIRWFAETVNNTVVLKRRCTTLEGTQSNDCSGNAIEMAKDILRFKLLPSKPGIRTTSSTCAALSACYSDTLMFGFESGDIFTLKAREGYPSATINQGMNFVSLKSFPPIVEGNTSSNTSGQYYVGARNGVGNWEDCTEFDFEVGETYVIKFDIPYETPADCIPGSGSPSSCKKYNRMASTFRPDLDHLGVGLRFEGLPVANIPDFLFYPPQNSTSPIERNFEFSVPSATKSCIAITAAVYGQARSGQITFSNFKLYRKLDKVYHFEDTSDSTYNPGVTAGADTKGKASVKAFRLELEIEKKSEKSKATMIIPVPNNGIIVHPSAGGI